MKTVTTPPHGLAASTPVSPHPTRYRRRSSGKIPASSTRGVNGGGDGVAAAGGGGEIAACSASNRGTRCGIGCSDGDGDSDCGGGGGGGGCGGGGGWCSGESELSAVVASVFAAWLQLQCTEGTAAASAPAASTAASGGRVVGLPPTSTAVSLSAGPTELDDCRTPAGGKAVCWRKFWIRSSAV